MREKWNQGYVRMSTLVIGFAILVLVGICVLAFQGYNSASYMIKASHTAEKVFYAASAYLEAEQKADRLSEFDKRAGYFGKALSTDLQERIFRKNYTGNDLEGALVRYHEKYQEGDIRYLALESAAVAGKNRDDNPILTMFENQITDKNLWGDAYLIEYNARNGKVLAVFYSGEIERFQYAGDENAENNVIIRGKKQLENKRQGYFGISADEMLD